MNLAIDITNVRAVLLADGWHKVADKSFELGAYEFTRDNKPINNGGPPATAPLGFKLKDEAGYLLHGPLTAILASRSS